MTKIILDLRHITDREALYDAITDVFSFPDYFGRNLDALYDCLTDIAEDTCVALILPDEEDVLPDDGLSFPDADFSAYLDKLRGTFEDAENDNIHLTVMIIQI